MYSCSAWIGVSQFDSLHRFGNSNVGMYREPSDVPCAKSDGALVYVLLSKHRIILGAKRGLFLIGVFARR